MVKQMIDGEVRPWTPGYLHTTAVGEHGSQNIQIDLNHPNFRDQFLWLKGEDRRPITLSRVMTNGKSVFVGTCIRGSVRDHVEKVFRPSAGWRDRTMRIDGAEIRERVFGTPSPLDDYTNKFVTGKLHSWVDNAQSSNLHCIDGASENLMYDGAKGGGPVPPIRVFFKRLKVQGETAIIIVGKSTKQSEHLVLGALTGNKYKNFAI